MATPETSPEQASDKLALNYDTALCIVPPTHLWPAVDRMRSLYDKAYEKWPPHVNLVYPFVRPESLSTAIERIESVLSQSDGDEENTIPLELDTPGVFTHKAENTLFLHDGNSTHSSRLSKLRTDILKSIRHPAGNYQMHMTIAQSEDANSSAHKFLLDKVGLLPTVKWKVDKLHVLVRQRLQIDGKATSRMKVWGTISLLDGSLSKLDKPLEFYDNPGSQSLSNVDEDAGEKDQLRTNSPYYFNEEFDLWLPYKAADMDPEETPQTFTVSSYNVLAEFDFPPCDSRHSLLLKNIFSKDALADVLVLQEVADGFLSTLLQDERVRERYPYTSHGPPSQPDVEPLPSLLNIVILSRFPFDWEFVSFHRKHKGSVVAKFRDIKRLGDSEPTILASVHLTHGLTDGAVSAKRIEIQMLLKYLAETYPKNSLIIAGDTNISTSSHSINAALQKKNISASTATALASFDKIFTDAELADAWTVSRSEIGDVSYIDYDQDDVAEEVFEGEQGATYDPIRNEVAAAVVGSGFNMRPQRFDRILVRGGRLLEVAKFNKFGFLRERTPEVADSAETYGSDHWGVRCVLRVTPKDKNNKPSQDISSLIVPVHLKNAPASLSEQNSVKECLSSLGVLPDEDEAARRKSALNILKQVLLDTSSPDSTENTRAQPAVIVVPVGSYALGVWTSTSDIDVLCIGPFSSNTFFELATPRLRKATSQGVKILRRVKANTGLMLELEVAGIKMDLQYCPAGAIAQSWPQVLSTPPTDPIWSLSAQTLSKLKALRDVDYLRRSIPDMASFRLAHRFIKTWAISRGIYTARFGFLGGIQISLLLARVHKLLAREQPSVSVPDLLTTFFSHYATFNWEKNLVFDPLFHKHRLQYTRTPREPLAILGYFPPSLNTAHAASIPSVRTIADEFKHANSLLSDSPTTWTSFLTSNGATDFLTSFKSYVKIDLQYWGLSPTRGSQFVGWLSSRCVMLLVDMNRRAPGIYARMWPSRFTERKSATLAGDDDERDYQAVYLIGLDKLDQSTTKEDMKIAFGAIQTALTRFEGQIRGDEKYFDEKSCWVAASVVNKGELDGDLRPDTRELAGEGEYNPGEDIEDSSSEDEEEEELSDTEAIKPRRKSTKKNSQPTVPILPPGQKFRTASDVINRIRWDPGMDSAEYIVGYEDRFVGARERALDAWKTEQTDEEFIPQHRILYFKRRGEGEGSEGVIVWERKTRRDLVFGSGIVEQVS